MGGSRRPIAQFRLATLNNESRELNDFRVQAFGLRDYFDFFICSGYAGEMKPGRAIYRTALEVSGAPAAETLFIDDKQENCEVARALGMQAIHFTSPAALRSSLTEFGITL
jgi:putative hydrolase of the HAD superfamily